jgi:nicotinate-nucleotide adenylyltransferase
MKIALFGGTFDPVHLGHLAVARAAAEKFDLGRVYFVPADSPPHKQKRPLTDYQHRFAMLALATADDPRFVLSLLDAPAGHPNYSIQTVRRLKGMLKKADKLYFLIGMDAFKDIGTWRQPTELLAECDFIVVSRPGFALDGVLRVLPESLRPSQTELRHFNLQKHSVHKNDIDKSVRTLVLPGVKIHLLPDVHERVSSTQIRAAAQKPVKQLSRYVPRLVAEYIKKERLYVSSGAVAEKRGVLRGKVLSFHGTGRQGL